MTKKELEEIRDRESREVSSAYLEGTNHIVAAYYCAGFDACAEILLPIIEKNKKTIETLNELLNNQKNNNEYAAWKEYHKEHSRAETNRRELEKLKAIIKDYEEALKFECGNRCAEQNPCNAKEALKKHRGNE